MSHDDSLSLGESLMPVILSQSLAEKYDYVGKLLKPGEEPTEYTDDEDVKDKKDWNDRRI